MALTSAEMASSKMLPGIARLRTYRRAWLRGDVLAGLTVAAYLVPQVMAYAELAGLSPVTGLWASIGPLAVYLLLGSSSQLSVGPESTTALMTAAALAPLAAGDPVRYAGLAAVLALLVGAWCLLARLARLGFLADLLSRPVLVGYLAGIAAIMAVSQLGKVTGVPVRGDDFGAQLKSFAGGLGEFHGPTLILGGTVLVFLLVSAKLVPKVPWPLVAMLAANAVVAVFALGDLGIPLVGEVPRGLPPLGPPSITGVDLVQLALPAAGIAVVGFSDNVLTARAFAARKGELIDANQELAALGAANVTTGLSHGFPVSCSGSRTVLGDSLGSRTQVHSLVALVVVLGALFAGGDVLGGIPKAALGALVIYAALGLVEWAEFRRFWRFRRSELVLALMTTAGVLALGVLAGVLVAVALSILDVLRRIARPHDGILGYVPGVAGMHDIDDYPDAAPVPGLVVYRYDAPLCFANAEDFRRRALGALEQAPEPAKWFLLNAEANVEIDITAADALEQLRAELERRGVVLALARVKHELHTDLAAAGLVEAIGEDRIFMTLPTAVEAYHRWQSRGEPA